MALSQDFSKNVEHFSNTRKKQMTHKCPFMTYRYGDIYIHTHTQPNTVTHPYNKVGTQRYNLHALDTLIYTQR